MSKHEADTLPPCADTSDGLAEARATIAALEKRRAEADDAHNAVTNLFVITRGLHETVDSERVEEVVRDVIVNFVGCEEVAFYEPRRAGGFARRWAVGAVAPALVLPGCELARILAGTERFALPREELAARRSVDPIAAIPLIVDGVLLGTVVLFALLPQRSHFEQLDREIFEVLSVHAANAHYAALLHRRFGALVRPGQEP